jgi:hypothetical protein
MALTRRQQRAGRPDDQARAGRRRAPTPGGAPTLPLSGQALCLSGTCGSPAGQTASGAGSAGEGAEGGAGEPVHGPLVHRDRAE